MYLNPPDKALVLCCDEKSQCPALERTQPGLPLGIGHIRTRAPTISAMARSHCLQRSLISKARSSAGTEEKHTDVEWLRFVKQIDREAPGKLDVHIVAGNSATPKHPKVKAWLAKHPRFTTRFTPTGSSWINLVERFFAGLTGDVVRDGSFTSVAELTRSIEAYLAQRNRSPKPYRHSQRRGSG